MKAIAIRVKATSPDVLSCFHGSSIHRFHGSVCRLLRWKLVEALMELVEASMEVVEASVVVNVSRRQCKLIEAPTTFMEDC